MRFLVITNLYPPYFVGGFELSTRDIVEGLSSLNHQVKVLTSIYQSGYCNEDHVWRCLPNPFLYPRQFGSALVRTQLQTKNIVIRAIKQAAPELIVVTGLVGIAPIVFQVLVEANVPHVYVIFDETLVNYQLQDTWYRFWNNLSPHWYKRILKRIERGLMTKGGMETAPRPRGNGYIFGSCFLEEQHRSIGLQIPESILLYPLIPESLLAAPFHSHRPGEPLNLLYTGRICREKGLHTILEALSLLSQNGMQPKPTLTIAGKRSDDAYQQLLENLISENQLNVKFVGQIPRVDLTSLYAQNHVLVFATQINEPFGMTPLEAMAAGTTVIATATGGTREYLRDQENGLIFAPQDAITLAQHIKALATNEILRQNLSNRGRMTAIQFTDRAKWTRKLDEFLKQIADAKRN